MDFRLILTSVSCKIEMFPPYLLLLMQGAVILKIKDGAKKKFSDFLSGKSDFVDFSHRISEDKWNATITVLC